MDSESEDEPKPIVQAQTDFHGRIFKLKNASSSRYANSDYVSFTTAHHKIRAIYNHADAMPIEFEAVDGQPNTYLLRNRWPNDEKWISFANDGHFLFARYLNKSDAMPTEFVEQEDGSYKMISRWPNDHQYISCDDDGKWLSADLGMNEIKAMRVQMIEVKRVDVSRQIPADQPVDWKSDHLSHVRAGQLKVMSFNLWNSLRRFPVDGLDSVARIIRAADCDVVGLQEVDEPTLVALACTLGAPYRCCWSAGLISRLPITAVYKPRTGRSFYGARVHIGPGEGQHVLFFNSHTTAYPYGPFGIRDGLPLAQVVLKSKQGNETLQFLSYLRELKATAPVVVVGDHNCPSHLDHTLAASASEAYTKGRGQRVVPICWPSSSAFTQMGYVDCLRRVYPDPVTHPCFTWPHISAVNTPEHLGQDNVSDRIDFVYVSQSKSMRVLEAEVLHTVPFDTGSRLPLWPSDHRAVRATIRL